MAACRFWFWFGFLGFLFVGVIFVCPAVKLLKQNFQFGWAFTWYCSKKKDNIRAVVHERRCETAKAHSANLCLCLPKFLWLLCQYYVRIPFVLIQGSFYESFIFTHWSKYLFQMRELGLPSGLIQQMSRMTLQSYTINSCNSRTSLQVSGVLTEPEL